MSVRNQVTVYKKELTEAIRDHRTLISSILVPLLLFPVLTAGAGYAAADLYEEAMREPSKIMVLGETDSPAILEGLRNVENLKVVPASPDYVDLISNKKIHAVVDLPAGFQASVEQGGHPAIKIYIFSGDLKSKFGATRIEQFFTEYRDSAVRRRLSAEKLPEDLMKSFDIKQENVVSPEKVAAESYGGFIPYIVILMCMTGAMYPAMDLTAGEKERGSMETILTSPISRTDLALGKFYLVVTASLVTAFLSVISMGTSVALLSTFVKNGIAGEDIPVLPMHLKTVIAVFVVALPVAVLFAAVLLTISLFARSQKEAQSYLTPLTFVVIVPSLAAILPDIELTPKLAIVPILNASLLCKELVSGTYHWNYIALIFLSTSIYAGAALFLTVKMFQRESVLFRS
jgi:sodium transport system permease protein